MLHFPLRKYFKIIFYSDINDIVFYRGFRYTGIAFYKKVENKIIESTPRALSIVMKKELN